MNAPLSELHLQTLTFLLQTGQKEQAIKYYSDVTHASSFQAKDAVNGLEQSLLSPQTERAINIPMVEEAEGSEPYWAEIDIQIQQGQLIQAIKIYRNTVGTDLKTAKEAVENRRDTYFNTASLSRSPVTRSPDQLWDIVDECLRADKKIEAIKVYRQIMNVDLKEAKDKVDERALTVKHVPDSKIKPLKTSTSTTDKFKILMFWLIVLIICCLLMSHFIQSITLVNIIRFFIGLFSF